VSSFYHRSASGN